MKIVSNRVLRDWDPPIPSCRDQLDEGIGTRFWSGRDWVQYEFTHATTVMDAHQFILVFFLESITIL